MTHRPEWLTDQRLALMRMWESDGYRPVPPDLYRECPRGRKLPLFHIVIATYNSGFAVGAGITAKRPDLHMSPPSKDTQVRIRKCLGSFCGGMPFMSSWAGNRLCQRCSQAGGPMSSAMG